MDNSCGVRFCTSLICFDTSWRFLPKTQALQPSILTSCVQSGACRRGGIATEDVIEVNHPFCPTHEEDEPAIHTLDVLKAPV